VDVKKVEDLAVCGWPIYVSNEISVELSHCKTDEEAFNQLRLSDTYTVVSVFGLFNRGKTHFLNQIGGVRLASGKKVHTKGLSFRIPRREGLNLVLLDTAGSNSPITEEVTEEAMAQKRTSEILIQELAFSLADIMIVVLNELTWADQEYIKILQRKISQ